MEIVQTREMPTTGQFNIVFRNEDNEVLTDTLRRGEDGGVETFEGGEWVTLTIAEDTYPTVLGYIQVVA